MIWYQSKETGLNPNSCFLAAVVLSEKWGNTVCCVFRNETVEYCVRGALYQRSVPCQWALYKVICHVGGIPYQRGTVSEVYTMSVGHCITGVPSQRGFMSVVSHTRGDITSEGYANGVLCHKGPMMSAPYHQWDATWQGAFPSVHNHCVSLGVRFVLLVVTVSVTTATPTD